LLIHEPASHSDEDHCGIEKDSDQAKKRKHTVLGRQSAQAAIALVEFENLKPMRKIYFLNVLYLCNKKISIISLFPIPDCSELEDGAPAELW
jgi:hypothetical protein